MTERREFGAFYVTIRLSGTYQNHYPGASTFASGYIANAVSEALETFDSYIDGKITVAKVNITQELEHDAIPGAVA